ncbi:MAG: hypothetical protein QM479_14280 [Pseudomonadota bacterium]
MKFSTIFLFLGMMLLLQSCTSIEGPEHAVKVAVSDIDGKSHVVERYDNIAILDHSLQKSQSNIFSGKMSSNKLSIERAGSSLTDVDTLDVWIMIRNRTNHNQQIEVRTSFFDSMGRPMDDVTGWTRMYLSPNSLNTYRTTSVKRVSDYYVEIREGQ